MYHIHLDHREESSFLLSGEPNVVIGEVVDEWVFITACLRSWDDLGILCSWCETLYQQDKKIMIFAPYFPTTTLNSLNLYAKILSQYTKYLITFDIHNINIEKVLYHYFSHFESIYADELPMSSLPTKIDYIIIPTQDNILRCEAIQKKHYPNSRLIQCYTDYEFSVNVPRHLDGNFLVVDKTCSNEWNLNHLAQSWSKCSSIPLHSTHLYLYVSHGIFANGLETIDPLYEKIYTTDSWCCGPADAGRLTIISLGFITEIYLSSDK